MNLRNAYDWKKMKNLGEFGGSVFVCEIHEMSQDFLNLQNEVN